VEFLLGNFQEIKKQGNCYVFIRHNMHVIDVVFKDLNNELANTSVWTLWVLENILLKI
jgi:hypothetical protein